jgi:hypothetical protein
MLSKCLEYLKREDFKHEVKQLLSPLLEVLVEALRPYLMYAIVVVLAVFCLLLSILYCVTRSTPIFGLTLSSSL